MTDQRATANALMCALIKGVYGNLDAAAETINARWGRGSSSKGTLSKRMSGALGWTLDDVFALEDAACRFPVSRFMAQRLEGLGPQCTNGNLLEEAGPISREAGEAVSAVLAAAQSAEAGDRSQAIAELADVERAVRRARQLLEAQE